MDDRPFTNRREEFLTETIVRQFEGQPVKAAREILRLKTRVNSQDAEIDTLQHNLYAHRLIMGILLCLVAISTISAFAT